MIRELQHKNEQIREGQMTEKYLDQLGRRRTQPINLGPATVIVMVGCFVIGWLVKFPVFTWAGAALYLIVTYFNVREDPGLFKTYAAYATFGNVCVGIVSIFQPDAMQLTFGQWIFGFLPWYFGASLLQNIVCIFLADL